ncbi:MAG: M23 family metallopeptidase [Bilophila wadsworthia]
MALAIALANVFASEINFISDLREGDAFEVLVEKRFRHDAFEGYGRVLGAKFTNQNKQHMALFHNERGRETYYNVEGDNLHRNCSRLRFVPARDLALQHGAPASGLGNTRPHQGIDYGAPTGTPIMAVGDGSLPHRAGRGYGKQVIIRHDNGLESLYGICPVLPKA